MGQKVHPNGIRLGIVKPWNSTWFANTKEFADNLDSDFKVRQYLTKELAKASVSRIVIERPAKSIRVTIHTARPGIVIGKKGEDVEKLRKVVADIAGVPAQINIAEVRKPELDAKLVADSITSQLERRVMYRTQCVWALKVLKLKLAAVWAARKSHVPNGTAKVAYRCTLCVLTSTTTPLKRTPLTV